MRRSSFELGRRLPRTHLAEARTQKQPANEAGRRQPELGLQELRREVQSAFRPRPTNRCLQLHRSSKPTQPTRCRLRHWWSNRRKALAHLHRKTRGSIACCHLVPPRIAPHWLVRPLSHYPTTSPNRREEDKRRLGGIAGCRHYLSWRGREDARPTEWPAPIPAFPRSERSQDLLHRIS